MEQIYHDVMAGTQDALSSLSQERRLPVTG